MRREEVFRKGLHVLAGLLPPLSLLLLGWTGSIVLALFLLAYIVLTWDATAHGIRLPIAHALVAATSRPGDRTPAGAIEFLLAFVVVALVFPLPYALATFALVGVGDGVAALAGQRWGRRRLPWNPRKTWLGLGAGVLAGVPAFVLFAYIGAQLQIHGYARMSNLWGPHPAAVALALILLGFPLLHVAARRLTLSGRLRRVANATTAAVAARFFVALVLPLTFLLVAPAWLDGPLLPAWGDHDAATRIALLFVPVVAMLAESVARGADNLIVSGVSAFGAYALVGALTLT